MNLKEIIKDLCKERKIPMSKVEEDLDFAKGYLSKLDRSSPNASKLQKIANYFGVTVDYLMTGEEKSKSDNSDGLNSRDRRDIAKDMENIREKLKNKEDGPASFDGQNLSEESVELLLTQVESMLKTIKVINKEKYNPYKNKKKVGGSDGEKH